MKADHTINYNIENSSKRMDEILDTDNSNYSEKSILPSRNDLTFKNGYYVNVAALFIDIIGSSDMTDKHRRPVLAKIYRCFLSECVAIMNSLEICKEININDDCAWGIFDTQIKTDMDKVFCVAYSLISMIKVLNYKLKKKDYETIEVGIGIDYGRALMVKAGYFGSTVNDVIWMGDVVNSACHLANSAGRNNRSAIIASNVFYNNLKDENKNLLHKNIIYDVYEGNVINLTMEAWYDNNCK